MKVMGEAKGVKDVRRKHHELETQMIISKEVGYIQEKDIPKEKIDKIFALLGGLINSIKSRSKK
ncbi:MAG: hypothetical protein HQM15_00465 [Deltaproteobacteria bacterium]|nr:hypothetical protein [Deltaproteobacteria bacterium]